MPSVLNTPQQAMPVQHQPVYMPPQTAVPHAGYYNKVDTSCVLSLLSHYQTIITICQHAR